MSKYTEALKEHDKAVVGSPQYWGDNQWPYRDTIREALEIAERYRWRPIEEADKKYEILTIDRGGQIDMTLWGHNEWLGRYGVVYPTHYMPLPLQPEQQGAGNE